MAWPAADFAVDPDLTRSFAGCVPCGRLAGPLHAYACVDSTQARAHARARAGAPEGTVVLADCQTVGRGQHRRPWVAPAGTALLFSVILRPPLPASRWPELPLA